MSREINDPLLALAVPSGGAEKQAKAEARGAPRQRESATDRFVKNVAGSVGRSLGSSITRSITGAIVRGILGGFSR